MEEDFVAGRERALRPLQDEVSAGRQACQRRLRPVPRSGDFKKPLVFQKCMDCHKPDPHNGQFAKRPDGGECASCHNVKGWKPSTFTVKEHASSAYPLQGGMRAGMCAVPYPKREGHSIQGQVRALYRLPHGPARCAICCRALLQRLRPLPQSRGLQAVHVQVWRNTSRRILC